MIGAGNVAMHFGDALKQTGYILKQIISREPMGGISMSAHLDINNWTKDYANIYTKADVYLIAVNDDSIKAVVKQLKGRIKKSAIVVHTSGSIDIAALKGVSANYGVLYPVQTLSKQVEYDIKDTPICVEASNSATLKTLSVIANEISGNVIPLSSEQRKVVHLAAVFANNFTSHILSISADLLEQNKIPFELLIPLVVETINKAFNPEASKLVTGPAVRGDKKVMEGHLKMLSKNKNAQLIYKTISDSIADKAKKK